MKQTTKMSRAVSQLEHMYNTLNADKFDSALPTPIVTLPLFFFSFHTSLSLSPRPQL